MARHRELLAQAQAKLLEQLRQLQTVQKSQDEVKGQLATLSSRREQLELARTHLDQALAEKGKVGETVVLSLAEVRRRSEKLAEEIRALEKLPPAKQALRYRTPVSQPVHSEELMFECHAGRVTFMDAAALLAEVRRDIDDKVKLLHDRWEVSDTAGPAGAFRLRYVLERERGAAEAFSSDASPDPNGGYRANVTSWQFEPVVARARRDAGNRHAAELGVPPNRRYHRPPADRGHLLGLPRQLRPLPATAGLPV